VIVAAMCLNPTYEWTPPKLRMPLGQPVKTPNSG
jgi:hypothetical protein